MMVRSIWESPKTNTNVKYLEFIFSLYSSESDKKRMQQENTEDGDNKLAKKARKLAEATNLGQKNSILNFVQPAALVGTNSRPVSKAMTSMFHCCRLFVCLFSFR
jgi:hypothetical protein